MKETLDFYKNKKVFITGHSGFKGAWLVKVLLSCGTEITGFSLPPQKPSLFETLKIKDEINSIYADIRDRDNLIKAVRDSKAEIVFHLAAQPLVRLSYQEPSLTYESNVLGTLNILESVRLNPVRSFVNITTDKVYENREWLWGYRENENLNGFDPYSNSKSCSELISSCYQKSFFASPNACAISTARAGNVIGGGDYSLDRIIPDCIRAVRANKEIIVRNPSSTRPYQYVLDCLSGYLLLAKKTYQDKALEGAYNFGPNNDENCIKTADLVEIFCEIFGQGASWKAQEHGGPHEANFLKLDSSKARDILGWLPRYDIKRTIEDTVEFAKTSVSEREKLMEKQINLWRKQ